MPEEYEVSLVVKCNHSPLFKFRVLWEERSDHSAHSGTEHSVKIVQDELWSNQHSVVRAMVWNFFVEFDI
jgi:hypothetical protein